MLIFNSADELVPSDQASAMGAALAEAGVPQRVTILPGTRHSQAYAEDALAPTIAFFRQWLGT